MPRLLVYMESDAVSITDPMLTISVNANQLLPSSVQSKDNYRDINVTELKRVIRAKNGLLLYDVSTSYHGSYGGCHAGAGGR